MLLTTPQLDKLKWLLIVWISRRVQEHSESSGNLLTLVTLALWSLNPREREGQTHVRLGITKEQHSNSKQCSRALWSWALLFQEEVRSRCRDPRKHWPKMRKSWRDAREDGRPDMQTPSLLSLGPGSTETPLYRMAQITDES